MTGRIPGYESDKNSSNSWIVIVNLLAFILVVCMLGFAYIIHKNNIRDNETAKVTDSTSGVWNNTATGETVDTGETGSAEGLTYEQLQEKQDRISSIVRTRDSIAQEIADKLGQTGLDARVDHETGIVSIGANVLFPSGSTVIQNEAGELMKEFVPDYLSILFSDKYRNYLDRIIIEGHADEAGSYISNLNLSQKRAYSVMEYILNNSLNFVEGISDVEKYFLISGASFNSPVVKNGAVDQEASRRVEFKFRLKDEELLNEIDNILRENK